jgi:peptide/nickel transport system substrate-binding protein
MPNVLTGRRAMAVLLGATFALSTVLHATSDAAAQVPQRGGMITAAVDLEPASLDPAYSNASTDRRVYNLFVENLLQQDDTGKFVPMLAESWEYAADRRSITFRLRKGVKFHDGTEFDAAAVKFNLDRIVDPAANTRARQYLGDYASADVIDSSTVRINMKQASGAFLSVLALEAGSMLSPTAIKAMGQDFGRRPVGTGPFKVVSWTSGRVEAERFDGYWRDGADGRKLPYLDKVVVRVISNTAVKIVELKAGGIQIGDTIQVKDFDQVERDPNLQLVDTIQGIQQYMAFNVTRPPFDNADLRKAVALAINRPVIERVISRGQGVVSQGLKPPSSLAYDKSIKGHGYDVAAAKAAYQKSGHKGPITLVVIQRDPDTQIAQMLQAMLKEAGIELKIEVLERQAWLDKVLGKTYQVGILRASIPRPDPDLTFSNFYGKNAKQNYSGFQNERIDALVDEARRESDPEMRRKAYAELQQILLDNHAETYFFFRPNKEVVRKEVQNFRREFAGTWLFDELWLKR